MEKLELPEMELKLIDHEYYVKEVDCRTTVITALSRQKAFIEKQAVKLEVAEEMAKVLQEVKRELSEMNTPWTNRLVKLIASSQAAWEKAGN